MEESELIREQADRIVQSGALGRSRSYARLLDFLVRCALEGRTPKELEIALNVFGKGPDFDPSQDSMVRVYAHNLRQKLDHYYATGGRNEPRQLSLARGEYRLSLTAPERVTPVATSLPIVAVPADVEQASAPEPARPAEEIPTAVVPPPAATRPRLLTAAAAIALLALGTLIGIGLGSAGREPPSPAADVAASPLWSPLLDDDLPVLIVVGDYYIFGERDAHGDITRLVRDFAVNSGKDLDDLLAYDPAEYQRYVDLDLTYLPRGSALALRDVLRVIDSSDKLVRVVSMSELNVADLKSHHVIYVGYLSALGMLEDFVFASSSLAVGNTYDELRDVDTGRLYVSEAGIMAGANRNYRDYGFLSTFPGPRGNQFVVVAGMRDAGLMQTAYAVSDPTFVRAIDDQRPDGRAGAPAFEMLSEVTGYARTNLDAMIVHASKLDYETIWGGHLLSLR